MLMSFMYNNRLKISFKKLILNTNLNVVYDEPLKNKSNLFVVYKKNKSNLFVNSIHT